MSPPWSFAAAGEADFEPLLALRLETMGPQLERLGRFDPERSRLRFRESYNTTAMRLIRIRDETIGCVAQTPVHDALSLANFLLKPLWHNSGLGSAVLRALLAEADVAGLPVELEVLKQSPAIRLYERHGFVATGEGPWDDFLTRAPGAPTVFDRVLAALSSGHARHRVIVHEAEGRSEAISVIRGNRPDQAAKAMVLDVRGGGGGRRHVLAILPGNRKLDFDKVAAVFAARKCGFASPETAQALTGCVMGAVPPFAFSDALPIVVDPDLLANDTIFFNAGRLDRSMEADTKDWLRIAAPRIERVAVPV